MKQSNFFHIILISGSTVISGIINYFYYPIMLKYLTLSEFGVFASLVSVINILSIFLVGVSLFLTKEYSKNIKDLSKIKTITYGALPILFIFGFGVYGVYTLLSPIIQNFLKIDEIWPVLGAGLVFPTSAISIIFTSLLRSLREFTFISITQILTPIFKIIIGFLLVYYGYNATGALGGLIISSLIVTALSASYVIGLLRKISYTFDRKGFFKIISETDKSIVRFIFESILFTLFMNADVLIIKNLFSPEAAGIYAGISVVGKFVIFLTMSLETVYYGQIMEHSLESMPRKLIIEPLTIILSIIGISVIGMLVFGEYILSFMRRDLIGNGHLLVFIVIYSGLLSYMSLVAKVLIGWGIRWINRILITGSIFMVGSIYLFPFSGLISYTLRLILPVSIIAILLSIMLFYKLNQKNIN